MRPNANLIDADIQVAAASVKPRQRARRSRAATLQSSAEFARRRIVVEQFLHSLLRQHDSRLSFGDKNASSLRISARSATPGIHFA